ncbi:MULTISPECIES: hypothetical protein [unclassified Leptolyngbya]|uniref:hypothetical protein n=1 Tax=unclassified Leptolyngbya TaxID=2650499 RepID=UPI00168214C5|nr:MULTISPECIES: hypothetical protein [unclassified Leptolyngbya]MBD1910985.1 hypothetical protein [Leptolyngbya sp. FACHB-8]MBD2158348.1 hypothetical protein [Leptolyngbya sp. FACHB-16]
MMKPRKPARRSSNFQYFLVGGSMLVMMSMLADMRDTWKPKQVSNNCAEIVQPSSILGRDELAKLLAIPERDRKEAVQAVVSEPYCRLPKVEIREGVAAEREVYPLAFDPQTWFVVLYEGDEYAGYSFLFQRNGP